MQHGWAHCKGLLSTSIVYVLLHGLRLALLRTPHPEFRFFLQFPYLPQEQRVSRLIQECEGGQCPHRGPRVFREAQSLNSRGTAICCQARRHEKFLPLWHLGRSLRLWPRIFDMAVGCRWSASVHLSIRAVSILGFGLFSFLHRCWIYSGPWCRNGLNLYMTKPTPAN